MYDGIDKECINLCKAINLFNPDIRTVESCCGHGEKEYRIWFVVENLEVLPHVLYWFDGCHSGYYGWKVTVQTDCAKQYPTFCAIGPVDAYNEAEDIAKYIRKDFESNFEIGGTTYRLEDYIDA